MLNTAIIACDEVAEGVLTVDTFKYFLDIERREVVGEDGMNAIEVQSLEELVTDIVKNLGMREFLILDAGVLLRYYPYS